MALKNALAVIARAGSSTVHPALFQTEMKALFEVLGRRPSITPPIGGWVTAVKHSMIHTDVRNWFRSVIGQRHTTGSSRRLIGLSWHDAVVAEAHWATTSV